MSEKEKSNSEKSALFIQFARKKRMRQTHRVVH